MEERTLSGKWVDNNIFRFRKGDGFAYFWLYLFVPVIATIVGLYNLAETSLPKIYFYLSVAINAANCIYDAINRWDHTHKTVKNTKLFCIILATAIAGGYSFAEVFYILLTKAGLPLRWDFVFVVYIFTIVVALGDAIACWAEDMAWKKCVGDADSVTEQGGKINAN